MRCYRLYARENIVHPDGTTGIVHKAGDLVSTLKVDRKGDAVVKSLYLGKSFVKEIQAPEGYVYNETEHDVECYYEGGTVPTIERTVKSTNPYEQAVPDYKAAEAVGKRMQIC